MDVLPENGLYLPIGHPIGVTVPAGQYLPVGHSTPIIPSLGSGTLEPTMHQYPAVHSDASAADCSPSVGQYLPGGQGMALDD